MSSLITWEVARGRVDELRLPDRSDSLRREQLSEARARRRGRGRFNRSRAAAR
jgi:hypothetical protein